MSGAALPVRSPGRLAIAVVGAVLTGASVIVVVTSLHPTAGLPLSVLLPAALAGGVSAVPLRDQPPMAGLGVAVACAVLLVGYAAAAASASGYVLTWNYPLTGLLYAAIQGVVGYALVRVQQR